MPVYLKFYFWLLLVSGVVFTLERIYPWRPRQGVLRREFVQDLFWMVFNGQYVSWGLALLTVHVVAALDAAYSQLGFRGFELARAIGTWPWWVQFGVFFVLKDLVEWNIHRGLHVVPWLWRFHRLHHSSEALDWAAAFRSHWGEIVIYKLLVYVPLVILGVDESVVFAMIVGSLVIQELSHANLAWDWGPLRYVFNSPRFHAWHHDVELHGRAGQNFGLNLAIWDWLFRTAYWPRHAESPTRFGLERATPFPSGIWARLWEPFRARPVMGETSAPGASSAPRSAKKETA